MKKKPDFSKIKTNFETQIDGLRNGGKPLLLTIILTFILMILTALGVFFANVQGEEKQKVPDVVGKPLTTALLELQEKELYPRLKLKYSEESGDEGMVLEQSPKSGTIVKAQRRIELTVSRGRSISKIEDYIGKDYEDVEKTIEELFGRDTYPILSLKKPVYTTSEKEEGTILAQYPSAGTMVVDPVKLQLVVSSGSSKPLVNVNDCTGMSIAEIYNVMKEGELVFDFTSHTAESGEVPGRISKVSVTEGMVPLYTRVSADFSFDEESQNMTAGIFRYNAPSYPYPVPVRLEVKDAEENISTLIEFNHPGRSLTIPYEVKKGSSLILYINNNLVTEVNAD